MKRKIFIILVFLVVFFGFFTFLAVSSARNALKDAKAGLTAIKSQDLEGAKKNFNKAKSEFQGTKTALIVFSPFRIIPVVGWYVADAQRGVNAAIAGMDAANTLADAITPYADVLGLKGQGTFSGGTAQERLALAIETLSKVAPQIDQVAKNLDDIKVQVDQIQSWRYPNFLPGKPGQQIEAAKKSLDEIDAVIADAKPLLSVLPDIMGEKGPKTYLVLFQNDKELRPTGGFITAYAFIKVEKGNITSEGSNDIYNLDGTLTKRVAAPSIILKYLPGVPNLNLRDTNYSPDYLASMKQFEDLYQYATGKKQVDGIVSLDTQFVLSMMDVLGPIDAYGTKFTTNKVPTCDCPQIIYELESFADQPTAYAKGGRKDILGVLMQQMMAKTFAAPKSSWPNLFATVISALREKHVIMYYHDPQIQSAVERINFAGRLYNFEGDYLHINEANFGGAKSNLYIQENVSQNIKKSQNGQIQKTVTIDYKYPKAADNCSLERAGGLCLAGIYRDYIRIYVPKGSKLSKSTGLEVPLTQTEDLDKTVFEGFLTVRPQGTAKVEFEYTVPVKVTNDYKLLVQKQPGTQGITYQINAFGKNVSSFPLNTDKLLEVKP